jgi:hypothetical protein
VRPGGDTRSALGLPRARGTGDRPRDPPARAAKSSPRDGRTSLPALAIALRWIVLDVLGNGEASVRRDGIDRDVYLVFAHRGPSRARHRSYGKTVTVIEALDPSGVVAVISVSASTFDTAVTSPWLFTVAADGLLLVHFRTR